jgi:tRNA modification GTPase
MQEKYFPVYQRKTISIFYTGESMREDTIAAIATAMAPSGIGIVRISGPDAIEVADRIYRSKGGKKHLKNVESHTIHYGFIMDEEIVIDEVMVLIMRAPNTYTKEDSVEIDCHGGPQIMQKILNIVLKNGARPAEPGEFTKRAFLNGRIDLSSAEAVIDLINSKNEFARASSLSQVQGSVEKKVSSLREIILEQTAFIEAALDDPEHYSLDDYTEKISKITDELMAELQKLINSAGNGSLLKEGINTVIVGKPNAGKSSLMNLLAGKEKAIVTEIAGTTRDVIEEQIRLKGLMLNITDTAGIRESEDKIEQIGVTKAKELMDQADLVLYVVDSSVPLDENDEEIIVALEGKAAIVLLNKSDLSPLITEEMLRERLSQRIIPISAKMQTGTELLEEAVEEMFFQGEVSFNDEIYITNERQLLCLKNALDALKLVKEGINMQMPEDFLSIDLLNAYESLGEITGDSVGEDLINEIFSKFCMGK